jgi:hypothetical protein
MLLYKSVRDFFVNKYKPVFSLFLLFIMAAHQSLGLVIKVDRHYGNIETKTSIEIWADNHFRGSKEENLEQLKTFIHTYLLKSRIHLVIESKFFYSVDCKNTNMLQYREALNRILGTQLRQWSFYESPQEQSQTTWIAWELPYLLLSIFSGGNLPIEFELNEEQRRTIIKNVTVEFLDPRLYIDPRLANPIDEQQLSEQVKNKFHDTNKSSPEKIKSHLANYVESRFLEATSDTNDPTYFGHVFDIQALSSVIGSLADVSQKKIVVLCGQWHAEQLNLVVPTLGFPILVKLELGPKAKRKLEF